MTVSRIFVSHSSALLYWRLLHDGESGKNLPEPRYLRPAAMREAFLSQRPGKEATLAALDIFRNCPMPASSPTLVPSPLHFLVPSQNMRRRDDAVCAHLHSGSLPAGAFLYLGGGVYVASPEMCLLQSAVQSSLLSVVELGFELCGTYSFHWNGEGFYARDPLASKQSIIRLLDRSPSAPSGRRLRRALPFLQEGAASPMETALVLMLCLPPRFGGYGIPNPVLNFKHKTGAHMRKITRQGSFACDLYWPDARLGVEYDSDEHHNEASDVDRDVIRKNSLLGFDIDVVTVRRNQLMDANLFDRTAHLIAKRLGVRIRPRASDWMMRRYALRQYLLHGRVVGGASWGT